MNIEILQNELIEYSKEIGVDKIGFATADPFAQLKARLVKQQELNYQSGFEEKDLDKRTTPTLLLPSATTLISIAIAYPSRMSEPPRGTKGERRGIFCRASWGLDYHLVLKEKLQLIEEFLMEKVPDVEILSMVDTGELSDRAVAERAGIGWSGKNCAIITPEFGSYVYLGELITNIPFEPSVPIEDQCGDCTKCIDACPTGALVNPGQIDAQSCLGFITQTKDVVAPEYREKIGNRIYGCDTCQVVCPQNKGINNHYHEEIEAEPELAKPLLEPLLDLNNREFKEKYGQVAGSWRGKNPIQRNAIVALANFKETSSIPRLVELVKKDARPVIRATAVWAIGKISPDEVEALIGSAMKRETEEKVLHEYERLMNVSN